MMSSIRAVAGSRGGAHHVLQSQRTIVLASFCRSLSSTANTHPRATAKPNAPTAPPPPRILDERSLVSQLSPLKRIVCLCPVPLGRGRVAWSGGDPSHPGGEANIDRDDFRPPPLEVKRYRYGERFAIGVAVSDPYLTHATPVRLGGDDALKRRFEAEIVPTFRCDAHNLGRSPIFHTNLPYFRNDFLQHIGHSDIGAIVMAMPMKPSKNPFCPMPTKVQLEQEQRLVEVREYLLRIMQNYVSVEDEEEDDFMGADSDVRGMENAENGPRKRHPRLLGPLNLQGRIDHRLSITDVLSKPGIDGHHGNWDHILKSLRQIQNRHTMGRAPGGGSNYFLGNQEYGSYNVFSSVPPEMHAAVALNATLEKYANFHNSFF